MKKGMLVIIVLAVALSAGEVSAKSFKIVVSPDMCKQEMESTVQQIATIVEPGEKAVFLNGLTGKYIGTFEVANKESYRGQTNRKVRANRKVRSKLNKFSKGQCGSFLRLDVPKVLRKLGELYPGPNELVLHGSLLYPFPGRWSMLDGAWPGDGMLVHSHYAYEIFGVKSLEENLKDYRIHWVYQKDFAKEEKTAFRVERALYLYLQLQSAKIITMSDDMEAAFERLGTGAAPLKRKYKIEETTKQSMERFVEKTPEDKTKVSVHKMPVTEKRLTNAQVKRVNDLTIGISWHSCKKADLDLFARSNPTAKVLYYSQPETEEGRHWRDYTTSPADSMGFETISYRVESVVDLNELLIGINFFGGYCPDGIEGTIRISTDGKNAYLAPFKLLAKKGNAGFGKQEFLQTRKAPGKEWVVIDALSVLGLKTFKTSLNLR